MRSVSSCLLLICLLSGRPLAAEEPAPPKPPADPKAPAAKGAVAEALARTAEVRATLRAPAGSWSYEGELVFRGHLVGTLSIKAEPSSLRGQPCWAVVERTVREAGKGRVESELVVELAPDLSLLRGETRYSAPGGTSVTSFGRRDGVLEVVEQGEGRTSRSAEPDVPASATLGLFALTRLVEGLPSVPDQDWRLPVFDPRFAFGDDEGKPVPNDLADLTLSTPGPATLYEGPGSDETRMIATVAVKASARSGRAFNLHLEPDSRCLVGVEGSMPAVHVRRMGQGGALAPPPWFERVGQPPVGALEAFVTFGRGYHLPKRELLDLAFHWPSMRAAEIAAGSYPADVTLEKVREDWVAEFESRSKHRTEADCDDLLLQLLTTAKITSNEDGSVSITALPVFGGHVFHCAPIDGRWWITKLD